jgi:hypothetical protein
MAHEKHIVDRLSTRLPSLLPEHIREDSPFFEDFLQAYFEYLESEIIVLESQGDLEGVRLEDGTSLEESKILIERGTDPAAPDIETSKLLQESPTEPFAKGEYIYGKTNGSVAKIKVINGLTLIVDTISGTGFAEGESIEGRDGQQTGVVKNYKENSVVASNRLLDYSDIDRTLESFLKYFQKDFIPSLDLKETQNARLTLKNIGSLYKQKGTAESVKFLMRLLYGENAEVKYPIDETLFASGSAYNEERRVSVTMDPGGTPKRTDKIVQYDIETPTLITADAIVENVFIIDENARKYSVSISLEHRGEFDFNREVTFIDRDGVTKYVGTLKGVVSKPSDSSSSIFVSLEDDSGDLLLETGSGIVHEQSTIGALYDMQDVINYSGGKADTDTLLAKANVTGLTRGGIERIFIEEGGINYEGGDLIIFDDSATGGNGAEALIGSVGDEIILEDALAFEQYEITATAGQVIFGGMLNGKAVRDDHNKPIAINAVNTAVEVHIDGIVQNPEHYQVNRDSIVFTTPPTLLGGERVEIFTDKSRLLYEDGTEMLLNAYEVEDVLNSGNFVKVITDQRIRSVQITNQGTGYTKLPTVFPGGYLYFKDVSGFQQGENIQGLTSLATGSIIRVESDRNRLVIKRTSTDINAFSVGETIRGSNSLEEETLTQTTVSSGTGATLFAYSDSIGGVEKLTITSQGDEFDSDAIIDATSYYNMMITTPTGNLNQDVQITGESSGATALIQSYDAQRHILKYKNLNGMFIDNEKVTYENSDSFDIIKNSPYTGRGTVAGEGLLNDSFLSDTGFADSKVANIHDSKLYQSHSYIIKVGESINNYRSIVKDLIHPSGHIFFGEVAVKTEILSSDIEGRFDVNEDNKLGILSTKFVPTIIITAFPTNNVLLEESTRDIEHRLLLEDDHLLENEDSRDNIAQTSKETVLMLWTTADEVNAQDMITQLRDAGNEKNKDLHENAHYNVHTIKKFINDSTNAVIDARVSLPIAPVAESVTLLNQRSPRLDGVISVLNLDTPDNDYYIKETSFPIDSEYGAIGVRPSDQGKVFQYYHPSEEILILEDGYKILNEEPLNNLRFDPVDKGDLHGHKILMEDDSGTILLEDETVPEDREYFVTERSYDLHSPFMYYEDHDRIVMENGDVLIKEGAGESVHTFVPLGPTFRTLNKIAFQNCYKISYYLLDEPSDTNDEDRILMEDGISGILMEDVEATGLTISQLEEQLGNFYVNDLPLHERKRTNIAFSSYVNSSNITNSTLQSL